MPEEIKEVKKDEDWMQKKWRPAMGWMYMVVCMMDMVIYIQPMAGRHFFCIQSSSFLISIGSIILCS